MLRCTGTTILIITAPGSHHPQSKGWFWTPLLMDLDTVMLVVQGMVVVAIAGFRELPSMPLEQNFNCVF